MIDVLVYKVITNYTGSWTSDMGTHTISAGNYLHVRLDEVTEAISVVYQASPDEGINILGTLVNGPNLFFGNDGAVQLLTSTPYQWCDGTTLKKIGNINNFPYAFIGVFAGALECVIAPTCDLEISSSYVITESSAPATPDGGIAVEATSSNGVIRYAIDDPSFEYAIGQVSPIFPGLYSGPHTIYAKDAIGCQDSITFDIPVTTVYGVRHRLDFTDLHNISQKSIRVDIEERAYTGPILEMCGSGSTPVQVKYEGDRDDASVSLVPSELILEILVEAEGEYTHLHTADDRQFKTKIYYGEDFSMLEIYHIGYIIPEFHQEPYLFPPYPLKVTSSCQLGEMKNLDFLDINDNKFKGDLKCIKVISEILKKTDLNLNIRCAINVFEENMETDPEDDPLDQVYVDSRIYYSSKGVPVKCSEALNSFPDPFRAQIFQSMGFWWILRLSESCAPFAYREFDPNGDYVTNGQFDPIKELDFPTAIRASAGAMFAQGSQILAFLRNYGYFAITHDLKKDGNLIDEGRFEEEDIIELASGNKTFKNWNYFTGQPGASAGFEPVINGDSRGAAYLDFTLANNNQIDNYWYSVVIPMDDFGRYKFKFQYKVAAKFNVPYIRIAWALKFHVVSGGDVWLTYHANGSVGYEFTEQINEIYVTKFDEWQTFEIDHPLLENTLTDSVQIFLYGHNHYGRDFDDIPDLKTFDLSALENPNGVKKMIGGTFGETDIYTAEYLRGAVEDSPELILPDNYDTNNGNLRWVWRLDKTINLGANVGLVSRTYFDNVSLAFYPLVFQPTTQYIEPQDDYVYSRLVNEFVKSDFSKTVLLGDMIRYNDEYTRNEKNIYRSYLRYADGTPTRYWARAGVDERKNLLEILLDDYIAQFSQPPRKLSGIKITNTVLHFVNCLRDNIDAKIYRPMTFTWDVLNAMYTPDMSAVAVGGDGGQVRRGAFKEDAFSTGFLIGS